MLTTKKSGNRTMTELEMPIRLLLVLLRELRADDMGFSKPCKVLLPANKIALDLSASSSPRIMLSRFLLWG